MDNGSQNDAEQQTPFRVHAEGSRMVPKFCTNAEVTLWNNNNAVITFLFAEPAGAMVIDRVAIDLTVMENLKNTFTAILEEVAQTEKEKNDES